MSLTLPHFLTHSGFVRPEFRAAGPHHHRPHPPHHGPRASFGRPFGPPPPGHPAPEPALIRHLKELEWMGAADSDLHDVIDTYIASVTGQPGAEGFAAADPGRGDKDTVRTPTARAFALLGACERARDEWMESLRGRRVLAAGEFPPHLLAELLAGGITVTQLHPAGPDGEAPPHFYHLATYGFRGATSLPELAEEEFDVVLVHGAADYGTIRISAIARIAVRMFPGAAVQLLPAEHVAPHMLATLDDASVTRIPVLD
jgi:hypothetical protein